MLGVAENAFDEGEEESAFKIQETRRAADTTYDTEHYGSCLKDVPVIGGPARQLLNHSVGRPIACASTS